MTAFHVSSKRVSERGFKAYALKSDFVLSDCRSEQKRARGENCVMDVYTELSGEAHGEAGKYEIRLLPGADRFMASMARRRASYGETLCLAAAVPKFDH